MKKITCLITGGSGSLGSRLKNFLIDDFKILAPPRDELDITKPNLIKEFFSEHSVDIVIHTAALARMSLCEKNPGDAIKINSVGTLNLVNAVNKLYQSEKKVIKFLYISTDGVYASTTGNYSETSETIPYNTYGWSKLMGEFVVQTLVDFCIVRTRFFDQDNILFEESADDILTSSIEIDLLVKELKFIIDKDFQGIINVGGDKKSDYDRYKIYKPSIKKCTRADIVKNLDFKIATDASMNISLLLGLKK